MYTRSYSDEPDVLRVPDGYSGTMLNEGIHTDQIPAPPDEKPDIQSEEAVSTGVFGNLFSTPIFKGVFQGFLGNGSFGLPRIGTEEILIIATAAFLFFASDGDKECAILLLLLLFIN